MIFTYIELFLYNTTMIHILPIYGLTIDELHNEFMTSADKLRDVLESSILSNFMKKFEHYFQQVGLDTHYTLLKMILMKAYTNLIQGFHCSIKTSEA